MKRKLIAILMACSLMIILSGGVFTTTAMAASPDEEMYLEMLWRYNGQSETYIVPEYVKALNSGAFYESPVKTVIIPRNVIMPENCFVGAYNLTDLYIYDPNQKHLYSYYEGTLCKNDGLGCIDRECSWVDASTNLFSTILNDAYAKHDKYVSKTLTIHGYKGSTAERFVEMLNSYPELFSLPQEVRFEPIEEEGGNITPGPTEPPVIDNNDSGGGNIPPTTEEPSGGATEPPDEVITGDVHLRGDGITKVVIKDNGIVTYPRIVYMKVGSKYFLELGNLPDGYSYVIPNTKSSLYSLNPQTGEFIGLKKGATMIKIRLYYPDKCYSNVGCQIYIEGEENEAT